MHQRTLFLTLLFAFGPLVLLAEPSPPAAKTLEYRVQRGDCLWNISKKVLKDPFKWPLIYTANEGQIRNPNLIYPGQSFAIPPPSAITKESLREAAKVAYARLAPIHGKGAVAGPKPRARDRSSPQVATGSAPVREIPSEQKAGSPPVVNEQAPSVPSSPPQIGMIILMVVVFLLVLVGVFLFWREKGPMTGGSQEPRPLSSFPEVRNVTPMPDPQAKPVEPTPAPAAAQPAPTVMPEKQEPRPLSSFPEVRNVAPMPEPQPNPVEPAPAVPESQVPSTGTSDSPATPSADKPGDNTPPPSSTHAA